MKTKYLIYFLFLLCSACAKEFSGQLNVADGSKLEVRNQSGELVKLSTGPARIKVREKGGMFSTVGFSMFQENIEWKIQVPKTAYFSSTDFRMPVEGHGEMLSLEGKNSTSFVGSGREQTRVSCTYLGYCYTCALGLDGKMDCGFKLSSMCSGSQEVIQYYNNYEVAFSLVFRSGSHIAADFKSNPQIVSSVTSTEALTSCH